VSDGRVVQHRDLQMPSFALRRDGSLHIYQHNVTQIRLQLAPTAISLIYKRDANHVHMEPLDSTVV
jgi:hypothetical protein